MMRLASIGAHGLGGDSVSASKGSTSVSAITSLPSGNVARRSRHVQAARRRLALLTCALACTLALLAGAGVTSGPRQVAASNAPQPLLSHAEPVDWWFLFKFNSKAFPGCGSEAATQRECPFGGDAQDYPSFGQQFVYASSKEPQLRKGNGCLGATLADPLGATFDEVYNDTSVYYVIWNDQFYQDPQITGCGDSCGSPWGHSKGMVAWNESGEGFTLQVTTPSWPAAGSKQFPRESDGNTLGCIRDNDVKVSQHFFALKVTKEDLIKVLKALQNASVVTDPTNRQIVHNGGPEDVKSLVSGLGTKTRSQSVSTHTLSSGVILLSKSAGLHVPPWQMVSALLGAVPLRTATWWNRSKIYSTTNGTSISCWDSHLAKPGSVEIAVTGQWDGRTFGLRGGSFPDANHAKIGVSTSPSRRLAVFGDLNQEGAIDGECATGQNKRGGVFYVLENEVLSESISSLLKGETAPTTAPD